MSVTGTVVGVGLLARIARMRQRVRIRGSAAPISAQHPREPKAVITSSNSKDKGTANGMVEWDVVRLGSVV